jgi:prefoldin subunit 5
MESKQEEQLNSILEIVGFIKDNSATKQELMDLDKKVNELSIKEDLISFKTDILSYVGDSFVTKTELEDAKDEILTKIDTFISLHNKVDTELTAMRSKYEKLEARLEKIAQHLKLEL